MWSDYICPWAYLGRDRTTLLRSLGVEVTPMPYELHPELPPEGRAVRPGGRLTAVHESIAEQCAEVGLPFRAPQHIPNSRRALETAEVVREFAPDAFATVDDALFRAHFVEGRDISTTAVLDDILDAAGCSTQELQSLVVAGAGTEAVRRSMTLAHEHGVAATPAWLVNDEFVLPGAQPRQLFERVVHRLRARSVETDRARNG